MDDYERVLLVKPDVLVYKIPPRVSNRAYRASEWNLYTPDWNCRMRLISKGDECYIKLDEKSTGQFFGKCPIDKYPGSAIEAVSDSSRYFVLRLMNEQTGRTAFVGIGFTDRSDSFDLNVALQDHFKIVQMENKSANESEDSGPKLDLKFKEGETIKVNLNIGSKSIGSKPRPKASNNKGGLGILLPPPPGSKSSSSTTGPSEHSDSNQQQQDLLDGLDSLQISPATTTTTTNKDTSSLLKLYDDPVDKSDKSQKDDTDWVDFADSKSSNNKTTSLLDSSPFSSNTKENDSDLWSDFTSCNTDNNQQSSSTRTTNSNNQLFDDWAKFQ